ncbi:MAG: ABC transporter ATP-binding protein [Thermoleophilaceae bacterium]
MVTPPSSAPETLIAENVSKTFRLPHEQVHTLKERALHPFRGKRMDPFTALDDVSFSVGGGEFFGIVGRNGSGKSTLLKCLAGIYRTDEGRILLRGRMATFIELGVGFNPELTARDNVIINGIMLGLTPSEARGRYDAVMDFAELAEFESLKLKNYSSGMYVRLAFATMIQVDADILLIDEVLAVGDVSFQQKCHEVLAQIRKRGRTILFVTHDMHTVEELCDRALLLERGVPLELGDPNRVARHYDRLNFERQGDLKRKNEGDSRHGTGEAVVLDAWFEDEHGTRTATVERGRRCTARVVVELCAAAVDPVVGFEFGSEHTPHLAITEEGVPGSFAGGERLELEAAMVMPFAPGRYTLSPFVRAAEAQGSVMDRRDEWVPITVIGTRGGGGLVDVPAEVRVGQMVVR